MILASHLGRPKEANPEMSLKPVAKRLEELLGRRSPWRRTASDRRCKRCCASRQSAAARESALSSRKEKNDPEFSRQLAALCDVYVNDAFGSRTRPCFHSGDGRVRGARARRSAHGAGAEVSDHGDPIRSPIAILGGARCRTRSR